MICMNKYRNMIIIPSYDKEGTLNYFTARSFEKDPYIKYRNPDCSRDIIPFELFINWDSPLVLCEGPFDAITVSGVSILGSEINDVQRELINNLNRQVIVVPDRDAPGEKLINQAIEFGWNVAFPEWDNKVEDVADAVLK